MSVYKRGRSRIEANLTPLIDVVFLLIVFFVLVSQIVEAESVELELPIPVDPATEPPSDENRVVINVIPGEGGEALGYRLGANDYASGRAGVEAMTTHLAALFQANPSISINLRADQRTHYRWVEPAMQAVTDAAVLSAHEGITPRVNIVVVRED